MHNQRKYSFLEIIGIIITILLCKINSLYEDAYLMMKKMMFLFLVFNSGITSAWGDKNPQYNNATLAAVHQTIMQKYINLSTREVAQRGSEVSKSFEREFLTNPDKFTPISEEREMQTSMELIRQALQENQSVSGFTLEINHLYQRIALEFDKKEKSLKAQEEALWKSKLGWGTVGMIGIGGLGVAVSSRPKSSRQMVAGGVGITGTLVGSVMFISTIGHAARLEAHRKEVQNMKNRWEESFKKVRQ